MVRGDQAALSTPADCGLILRRVLAASDRDLYFVLASSRVTSRSPLQSPLSSVFTLPCQPSTNMEDPNTRST